MNRDREWLVGEAKVLVDLAAVKSPESRAQRDQGLASSSLDRRGKGSIVAPSSLA